jgi:DNA polymerase III sliding clamp (beta) subunit (PCNA family)
MTVTLGEREATFASEIGRLTARIIDATFPNYRQLLPEEFPNSLEVSKEALLEAVGRAALVAEDHIPVRLNLHDGGVELSVVRQEVGEETEHIEGTYKGDEMTIAFNTRYLTDGAAEYMGIRSCWRPATLSSRECCTVPTGTSSDISSCRCVCEGGGLDARIGRWNWIGSS